MGNCTESRAWHAEVCPKRFEATVQRAVGFAKWAGQKRGWENWADPNGMGPGAGCEAPLGTVQGAAPTTVQMAMIRAGYPMVGRSFGRALVLGCTVRRSLYHTHWVCAVCCAQWAVPTDQLAQFGTKRAKRGPGVRGLWPQLWAPTISPVLGGSITSPPVGGSITS